MTTSSDSLVVKWLKCEYLTDENELKLPQKATEGAAGYDIFLPRDELLDPEQEKMIGIGWHMSFDPQWRAEIKSRSSSRTKLKLSIFEGLIDSDYLGEVKLVVKNMDQKPIFLRKGMRIAQFIFTKNPSNEQFVQVQDFSALLLDRNKKMGKSGFGSTGY